LDIPSQEHNLCSLSIVSEASKVRKAMPY